MGGVIAAIFFKTGKEKIKNDIDNFFQMSAFDYLGKEVKMSSY